MGFAAGDRIGRYALVRQLGRGAMGEVWEAVLLGPHGFRREVALKLLTAELVAGPSARAHLISEARLGALLSHPNIAGTHELGESDGHWFIAMELIRGASVQELFKEAPLSAAAVVDVGIQACAGLAHAHALQVDGRAAGLVHRDLKPSNLMVDRYGIVKLVDLGIARLSTGEARVAGTPGYMAPEQLDGDEDHRADLFALGVTLYLLATRRRPFGRAPHGVLRADAVRQRPAFLRPLEDAVPGLAPILSRCMAGLPDERWPDASSLGAALRGLMAGLPPGVTLAERVGGLLGDSLTAPGAVPTGATATGTVLRGNLPPDRDRFVGRADDLSRLRAPLSDGVRLTTLTGLGGMGKTRLSLQVARRLQPELAGGAWLCALAGARTVQGLLGAVADTLGVQLGGEDPDDQIAHALRARGRALFVLDNAEQIAGAVAGAVSRWIDAAPDAQFLVTSRVPLGVRGEHVVPLGPLSVGHGTQLFVERAARSLDEESRAVVRTLVHRLDGIPLAIELAAARTRVLTPEAILARLEDRFQLLADGRGERPERHRSLRASLDGSWDLLNPFEQAALTQLSVFADGWTLQGAEAVLDLAEWPGAPWTLDILESLVDASLLRFDPQTERFQQLVSIQDYASERLAGPERSRAEARHGRFFAQLGARDALEALRRRGSERRFAETAAELDNLIAACRRALRRKVGRIAAATALAAAEVLALRGPHRSAVELLEPVSRLSLRPAEHARVLAALSRFLTVTGDRPGAIAAARQALEVVPDDAVTARILALAALGEAEVQSGHFEAGLPALEEAQRLCQTAGEPLLELTFVNHLAKVHQAQGRSDRARALYEAALARAEAEAVRHLQLPIRVGLAAHCIEIGALKEAAVVIEAGQAVARKAGHRRMLCRLASLRALVADYEGRMAEAADGYRDAARFARSLGLTRIEGINRVNLGSVYAVQGKLELAVPAMAATRAFLADLGMRDVEPVAVHWLGVMAHERGEVEHARALYAEAAEMHRANREPRQLAMVHTDWGRLERESGDPGAAEAFCVEALDAAEESGDWAAQANAMAQLAGLLTAQGDFPRARALLEDALELDTVSDQPWLEGVVTLEQGRLAHATGDLEEARAHLAHAVRLLRRSGYRVVLGRALIAWAAVLRAAGRPDAGAEALAEVRQVIADLAGTSEAPLAKQLRALVGADD